jgi:hypothetical protein
MVRQWASKSHAAMSDVPLLGSDFFFPLPLPVRADIRVPPPRL